MTFFRPQCATCGASSPASTFEPVEHRCTSCGKTASLVLPADGSTRSPVVELSVLLGGRRWLDALRTRHEAHVTIADVCGGCRAPIVLPWSMPLSLRCGQCASTTAVALGGNVVDVLPTAVIDEQTWGGGMTLTWTPEHRQGGPAEPIACPGCGGPVPPFEGTRACDHCRTALFGLTACGRRFLPGVRVRGNDEGRPVDRWMALTDAIDHYLRRRELASASRKTTWGLFGIWMIVGFVVFPILACVWLGFSVAFADELGPNGLVAAFLCVGTVPLVVFGTLIAWAVRRGRAKRSEIVGPER